MSENREEETQQKKVGWLSRRNKASKSRVKLSKKQKTALKAIIVVLLTIFGRRLVEGFAKKGGEYLWGRVEQRLAVGALSTSRQSPVVYKVALMNRSSIITDAEAEKVMKAIQTQVHRDLAPVWGVDAELTYLRKGQAPPPGTWWVEIDDEATNKEDEGYLSYHYATPEGLPRAKVFAKLANQDKGWSNAASHVLLSMLVNPRTNLFTHDPTSQNQPTFYYVEITGPCQSESYQIDGVTVSDFVYPAWFGSGRVGIDDGAQFDYLMLIDQPMQVLKGSFADVFRGKQEEQTEEEKPDGFQTIWGGEQGEETDEQDTDEQGKDEQGKETNEQRKKIDKEKGQTNKEKRQKKE